MLNIHQLSLSFSGSYLFNNISFRVGAGDRIGLIGKNGAGKSTLLNIISGDLDYDSGDLAHEKNTRIGFLQQDIDFEEGQTVREETCKAFPDLIFIEQRMSEVNTELSNRQDYESESYNELMVEISELTEKYQNLGGYTFQGQVEKILQGLGFQSSELDQLTSEFSGGWRMRIELAKLLLQDNDILLLDEPTNHLDIESIIWLESFLKKFKGALILVSHDKMFLNQVTNRTIEITSTRLYDFKKPYSAYLNLRSEIREQQLATQKNQEKEIARTEQLIERFRAKASKATMAQSLLKKLDKIDRVSVDEQDHQTMSVRFPVSNRPGKVVVELDQLSVSYGSKSILTSVNMLIERGDKIAFVGQNGQGKTTLAKAIVGELDHTGSCNLGHNVQLGYFAQNQASYLNGDETVLDSALSSANEMNRIKVRDMLGAFLFRGDAVDKYVRVLSGGERNRLALCKLLLQPFNVLVMDEPTNHLDIQSKNVLKEALANFEGTLLLVSHDREFLQGLADKVYEFKDHKVNLFLGDIDQYLEHRNALSLSEIELSGKSKGIKNKTKKSLLISPNEKRLKNKINLLEKEITIIEKEIKAMDNKLAMEYTQSSNATFFEKYNKKKAYLSKKIDQWEKAMEDFDNIT